jgi:hypothetical protein
MDSPTLCKLGDLSGTFDATCVSHNLSNAGALFLTKLVDVMKGHWNQLVSHSGAIQAAYRLFVGITCPRLTNSIRWYCSWEMCRDILYNWKKTAAFVALQAAKKDSCDSVKKLNPIMNSTLNAADAATRRNTWFELAVLVSYGKPMCRLTYYFERSYDLVICFAMEKLELLMAFMEPKQDLPASLQSLILMEFEAGHRDVGFWKGRRDAIITPVSIYLKKKFPEKRPPLDKLKATRRFKTTILLRFAELLRPSKFLLWLSQVRARADADNRNIVLVSLSNFGRDIPFLTPALISRLAEEVSAYEIYAKASIGETLKASNLAEKFWLVRIGESTLKAWCECFDFISLIPASSADVERVVSVFTDIIGDDQKASLESTIETRTMLRFNNRKPKKRIQRRFYDDGENPSDEEIELVEEGAVEEPVV